MREMIQNLKIEISNWQFMQILSGTKVSQFVHVEYAFVLLRKMIAGPSKLDLEA